MTEKKRALVTGIHGMFGSHTADYLLENDYEVFGLERRTSNKNRTNVAHLEGKIEFLTGDLLDQVSLCDAIKKSDPCEIYNFAAQAFVGDSWRIPEYTINVTGLGVLRILEAIRQYNKSIKFFQASSSEMLGRIMKNSVSEMTDFQPKSPYAIAKVLAYWTMKNYRDSYNMFCCTSITHNSESERRGHDYVTRKITDGVAKIYLGMSNSIILGNLEARRDWSYCPDLIPAIHAMMQLDKPDDFVLGTGTSHSIREFLDIAFECIEIKNWSQYVKQDPKFFRPVDVEALCADYSKAKRELGWEPKTTFRQIVEKMVRNDIDILSGAAD